MKKLTRRDFLTSAAILAAPTIIPMSALGAGRPRPGDRVTMGLIGCGGRGFEVLHAFLRQSDAQVVAVCDVHNLHYRDRAWGQGEAYGRDAAKKIVESHYAADKASGKFKGCEEYVDYRELLARNDIDAVIVATPDHWHAEVDLAALKAGKDVYGEKPLTHFFAEGQLVYHEAAKQNAVFQVGSQQRSEFKFRQAVELVRNGFIGAVKRVEVGLPRGYAKLMGDATVQAPPEGLDYDRWCGPGPVLPYMRARHHRWWRGHRGYGGGSLMDFIGHHNDIAHWGLDMDQSGPEKVEAIGWTRLETDIYNTPIDFEIRCQYPGQIESVIGSKFASGVKWIGEKGWVKVARGNIEASDERWVEPSFNRGPWKAYLSKDHAELSGLREVTETADLPARDRPSIHHARAPWVRLARSRASVALGCQAGGNRRRRRSTEAIDGDVASGALAITIVAHHSSPKMTLIVASREDAWRPIRRSRLALNRTSSPNSLTKSL